ncbi:hypothetical protein DITRI_Ditri17bG0015300 [Diplodiscus trichospermus]
MMIWERLEFRWGGAELTQEKPVGWDESKVKCLNQDQLQQLMFPLWAIWNDRNNEASGEGRKAAHLVTTQLHQYILEYNEAQKSPTGSIAHHRVQWRRPPNGIVEVNFDRARNNETNRCRIGIVARDEDGSVLGARAMSVEGCYDPCLVEAMTALTAIEFSCEMGFQQVEIEGGSLGKVPSFQQCYFRHIGREGNQVAHNLAKYSLNSEDEYRVEEEDPSFLEPSVLAYNVPSN